MRTKTGFLAIGSLSLVLRVSSFELRALWGMAGASAQLVSSLCPVCGGKRAWTAMKRHTDRSSKFQGLIGHSWTLMDGNILAATPFHGGNTGSSPVGRATKSRQARRRRDRFRL